MLGLLYQLFWTVECHRLTFGDTRERALETVNGLAANEWSIVCILMLLSYVLGASCGISTRDKAALMAATQATIAMHASIVACEVGDPLATEFTVRVLRSHFLAPLACFVVASATMPCGGASHGRWPIKLPREV